MCLPARRYFPSEQVPFSAEGASRREDTAEGVMFGPISAGPLVLMAPCLTHPPGHIQG